MKLELLPCPFCGEQPMVSEKTQSVYCKNALCPQIIANESDNLTDAIQGWNTRADHIPAVTGKDVLPRTKKRKLDRVTKGLLWYLKFIFAFKISAYTFIKREYLKNDEWLLFITLCVLIILAVIFTNWLSRKIFK